MPPFFKLNALTVASQTTYCRLRDWLELPCPELEAWLQSNILPLDTRFSKSLEKVPRPRTILDDKTVQAWFDKAKKLDSLYCDELKSLIQHRSLGFKTETFIPKWLKVCFPLPISCSTVKTPGLGSVSIRMFTRPLQWPCQCNVSPSKRGWRKMSVRLGSQHRLEVWLLGLCPHQIPVPIPQLLVETS